MNEIKTSKVDIGIVVIFTTLSIFLLNIPMLNNTEISSVLKVVVLFLPGYSLLALMFPDNNIGNAKLFLSSILCSVVIAFLLALLLGVFLNFSNEIFINVLLIVTNILIAVAFIRRLKLSKEIERRYIICEDCKNYYRLKENESLANFEACRCGGKLKYDEGMDFISVESNNLDPPITLTKKISKHRFFLNFSKYRYLLVELVKRDIKVKYKGSILGIFWSFLNPLLMMMVLTIIFSTFFGHNIVNYPVYLLTGRLVFELYAQGSKAAMTSIRKNASIIKKVYVPKYMYSLSSVLSSFVTFLLSLVVLFGVMLVTNAPFTIYILFAILPIFLLLIFTIGAGLVLATVTVFFRDIEHLYGVFITMLMYGSAIFYPIDIVPESYRFLFELNPVYAVISLCRDSFLYGRMLDLNTLLYVSVVSVVILILGVLLFYKYQDKFILYV